jgi:hypothetical protein
MRGTSGSFALLLGSFSFFFGAIGLADAPSSADHAKLPAGQKILELPIRVVDPDGKPVAKVKITPWALRSSQGHGWWRADDKRAGFGPQSVVTDDNGAAAVLYPLYRSAEEQTRTTLVSVEVDHPEYAYINAEHIDVPLATKEPYYQIKLTRGASLEIRPLLDGKPADLADLYVLWSDGRSWHNDSPPQKTSSDTFRMPAMAPGKNSVLLIKLDDNRASHFSKITDFEISADHPNQIDVELHPSLRVAGRISDNVPRPIRNGRLKTETLNPDRNNPDRAAWFSWFPINSDGTFVIDGWPAGEPMQLAALCDGYIAVSGKAPAVVKDPPDPKNDFYYRPQVFEPKPNESIEVAMKPLDRCEVKAVDENEAPLAGVKISAWPNVGWWNSGSQVYCDSLVRSEDRLHDREYSNAVDKNAPEPFEAKTNDQGIAVLELPARKQELGIESDIYELPVFLGSRDTKVEILSGQTTHKTLRLQPRGTDKLGQWDKLAGVVFGCTTRDGRQLCALPGVRQKMDEFEKRFREAKDKNDPQLLSEANSVVSNAFLDAGDPLEARKWQLKADEEKAKVSATDPPTSK